MRKTLVPVLALALTVAACSKQEQETYNPNIVYSVPNNQPGASANSTTNSDEGLEDRLADAYGAEAAEYAMQIVDNGRKIRESPGKQENLYDRIEQDLRKKFPLISPPRLFGFIDEPREAENVAMLHNARERVLSRAKKDGIDLPMSFIIAALSNEGFSLDVDRGNSYNSGFGVYGLDTFGTEFNRIVERGYLPASFRNKFTIAEHTNEAGRRVKSADFTRKQDAYEAFIATQAHRQYLFLEDLSKNKIPKEQVLFFTYKYYNGGPNSSEGLFKKMSVSEIDRFFKRVMTYGSTGNAYVVLAGSQWLELSGATNPNPQGKYWWSK